MSEMDQDIHHDIHHPVTTLVYRGYIKMVNVVNVVNTPPVDSGSCPDWDTLPALQHCGASGGGFGV